MFANSENICEFKKCSQTGENMFVNSKIVRKHRNLSLVHKFVSKIKKIFTKFFKKERRNSSEKETGKKGKVFRKNNMGWPIPRTCRILFFAK